MKITPKLRDELKRVVWDYAIDEEMLVSIFEGKTRTFSLTQAKLHSRLLLSTNWYTLLNYLGTEGIKELLTDEAIDSIWIKDVREKFYYAREALRGIS
jgi:hypothetical protein